jgi:hypothetical protein
MSRHRHGWTRSGLRFGLVLLLLLWITGGVLELWSADAVFQLAGWQAGLRRISVIVHGAGTWVACAAAGRWLWPHVALVWRMRTTQRWWLGVAAIALTTAIVATGLALLYGPGDWHDALGQVHWWIAVGWPLLVLLHAVRWRRRRG